MIDVDEMKYLANKYDLPVQAFFDNNLDINPPPADDNYIGYIYRWINLNTLRWYIGKKKSLLGNYDFSSEDVDFCRDFTDSNIKWRYEIMEYIDTTGDDLTNREREILVEKDAMNDPMSYNKSNGQTSGKKQNLGWNVSTSDLKKILKLYQMIKEGVIGTKQLRKVKKLRDDLRSGDLSRIQFRLRDDPSHANKIKDRVDLAGNADKCDFVIILVNVWYKKKFYKELLVSGNHRVIGLAKTKVPDISCLLVEGEIVKKYTDDLDLLAGAFNIDEDKVDKPNLAEDFEKYCENKYKENSSFDFNKGGKNFETLKEIGRTWFHLTPQKVSARIYNVKKKIKNKEAGLGKLWIDYKSDKYSKKLKEKKKNLESREPSLYVRSWCITQALQALWSTLAMDLLVKRKENKDKIKKNKIKKYMINCWFPDPDSHDRWYSQRDAMTHYKAVQICKTVFSDHVDCKGNDNPNGIEVIIDYMPTTGQE